MTDIKQISDEIYDKEKTKSDRDFIDNYRKYETVIEELDYNSSEETYNRYSQIIADYGIALSNTRSFKKAIPIINQALDLFINNKKYTPDTLRNIQFYEVLLFNRAICNYYLDKFELAKPDFELLIKLYPDNTDYPKWIYGYKTRRLNQLRNILMYIVTASIVIECFFENFTIWKYIFLGIGVISIVISRITELIILIRKRKYSA
ncbi:MAG: tetratricopeptide repeat protein [Paludibacter sp.]